MKYQNISEKYGNDEFVTLADYQELNPDGNFELKPDGIYEDRTKIAIIIDETDETNMIQQWVTPSAFGCLFDISPSTIRNAIARDKKGSWHKQLDGRTRVIDVNYAFERWCTPYVRGLKRSGGWYTAEAIDLDGDGPIYRISQSMPHVVPTDAEYFDNPLDFLTAMQRIASQPAWTEEAFYEICE